MTKTALKKRIRTAQQNRCALTDKPLPEEFKLYDTDRITPKMNGGTYTDQNTRVVDPVAHMKRHDNHREREKQMENLKSLVDARNQIMKLRNGCKNRIDAMLRRTDHLDDESLLWLEQQLKATNSYLNKLSRKVEKAVKNIDLPLIKAALGVAGVGPISVAYMLVYVEIEKAKYASSLWSYTGLDKSSNERYEKGVSGGGNKTLRTALYTMAEAMMKNRNSAYRDVYDNEKRKKEQDQSFTKTRNTQGKLVEARWCDVKPGHRHGHALRMVMKHFLADWWMVHRKLEGLPTPHSYAIEKLGHYSWIYPHERGWTF